MTDKQIIIDVCPYQGECSVSGCKRNDDGCFVRQLFEERNRAENRIVELNKSIQAKEQECEEFEETVNNLIKVQYGLADRCTKYSQALTEIKELLLKTPTDSQEHCVNAKSVILQKCEVLDE